jgi:hypothetical protein
VRLSFTNVKDEASFFISMVEILHVDGWQMVSSIEGKLDHAFGEEMLHISHFHMSLWIRRRIPNMQLK